MADGEEWPFEPGTILVRDLAQNTTEDDLRRHFTRYGDITEAIIPFDGVTGNPHSFGFVTFSDPAVITTVLSKPHPINNVWAEVSRAMKGEDLQTLESQRILPRSISSSHIVEGPGDSDSRSISLSGPRSSKFTRHEVNEYFLGYGNVFSCSFICEESRGLVVFSNERTVDRVLRKRIHNLNGRRLHVRQYKPTPEGFRHTHNINLLPSCHGDISLTHGGADRTIIAPTNHCVILGSQGNEAVVGDQRLEGEAVDMRRGDISAPNMTIPQTRHLTHFGGHRPDEGGYNVIRGYEPAPHNTRNPYTNYHAVFLNHEIVRPYESAPITTNPNRNRGINIPGDWSDNLGFGNRMDISIDLGSRLNDAVFGDHRVIRPYESASNTTISHTNSGVNLGYWWRRGVLSNNQLEGKEFEVEQPRTLFPILPRDHAGESSSSNDLPSQEEFDFSSYNQRWP